MKIALYQVDAFTSKLFGGNPAAVCPLEKWLPDAQLQAIAAENNLAETAFFVENGERYHLRWFTPECEVDLCGHATLATAYVILNELKKVKDHVVFDTRSGELSVQRDGRTLSMDFPSLAPSPCEPPAGLLEALGGDPLEVLKATYYLAVYGSEAEIRALKPDMTALASADRTPVIAASHGDDVDFVSRFFAPGFGVPEDPVTGSAHCTLTPFFAQRLCKTHFRARQISARGGELTCELRGERVIIAGDAVLYLRGVIEV
jgi:PhzF family phenazine biosynthesis protein